MQMIAMNNIKYILFLFLISWYAPTYVTEAKLYELAGSLAEVNGLDISVNDNGDAIAVWGAEEASCTIQSAYFTRSTSSWSAAVTIPGSDDGIAPWVFLNNAGKAVAVWQTGVDSGDIVVNTYVPGSGWNASSHTVKSSAVFTPGSPSRPTRRARVGLDSTGNAVIVWMEVNTNPSPTKYYVYGAHALDTSGANTGVLTSWTINQLNTGLDENGVALEDKEIVMDPISQSFLMYSSDTTPATALISWVRDGDGSYLSRYPSDGITAPTYSRYSKINPSSSFALVQNCFDANPNGYFLASTTTINADIVRVFKTSADTTITKECVFAHNLNSYDNLWTNVSSATNPTLHQAVGFYQNNDEGHPFPDGRGYSIVVNSEKDLDCESALVTNSILIDQGKGASRCAPMIRSFDSNNAFMVWSGQQSSASIHTRLGIMQYDGASNAWDTNSLQLFSDNSDTSIDTLEYTGYRLSCSRKIINGQHNMALLWWDATSFGDDYYIRAINANTYAPGLPSPARNLCVSSSFMATTITLEWDASPDSNITGAGAGYEVYRLKNGETDFSLISGATPLTVTTYTDSAVNTGETYTYFVRTINADGLFSNSVRVVGYISEAVVKVPLAVDAQCTLVSGAPAVAVTWSETDVPTVIRASYQIYRASTTAYTLLDVVPVGAYAYQDTQVEAGSVYTYYVVALSINGVPTDPSKPATAGPCAIDAPPAPQELNATCVSTTEVDLSWVPANDTLIDGQKIYRDGCFLADTPSKTDTTYSDSGLTPGQEYVYEVRSVKDGCLLSNPIRTIITCSTATLPDPLVTAHATCGSRPPEGPPFITVTWTGDKPENFSTFRIYRNGRFLIDTPRIGKGFSYTDNTIAYCIPYYYSVSIVDTDGNESDRIATNTVICFPDAPDQITDLSSTECAVDTATEFFKLTWTSPAVRCTHQVVYRDGLPVSGELACSVGEHTDYFDVAPSTAYTYFIRVYNGQFVYTDSTPITIECLDTAPPGDLDTVCILDDEDELAVQLTWNHPVSGTPTAYKVYRNNRLVATLTASDISFVDKGIERGITYSYSVGVVTASGEKRSTTVPLDCPVLPVPENVEGTCTLNDFGLVEEYFKTITWTVPSTSIDIVKSQSIYRNGALIATVSASTRQFQDHDRPAGVSETYEIRTSDGLNVSEAGSVTVTC